MSANPDAGSVTDRREEITHNHIPESFREHMDSGGNIVVGTMRRRPRLDALGRPLQTPEQDELGPLLERTKIKPRDLPTYSGGDTVAYIAGVAGLSSVGKACARADKAVAAWADAERELNTARKELRDACRGWRTEAAIDMNSGNAFSIPPAVETAWRKADERVRLLEAVLGETTPGGRLKSRPSVDIRTMILADAIASLSFDEVAELVYAAACVGAHQGARKANGLPPAPLPLSTKEVTDLVVGVMPASPSWMREHPKDRARLRALRNQLGPHIEELRGEMAATTRQRLMDAA